MLIEAFMAFVGTIFAWRLKRFLDDTDLGSFFNLNFVTKAVRTGYRNILKKF